MDEADLTVHLSRQTKLPIALVPADMVAAADGAAIDGIIDATDGIVLIDVLDVHTQLQAGRHLLRLSPRTGAFVAGSSGVNYAILKAWTEQGDIAGVAEFDPLPPVERVIAVSGSCSPTTARQIRHAIANGFTGLHADPLALAQGGREAEQLEKESISLLRQGKSVLIYTALDPETDKGADLDRISGARHRVGEALGRIARAAIAACGLTRAILAGGDTSSHALGQLDIFALTTRFPLAATPGSPLCRGHSADPALDGIEIAMKGGQVGGDDYFTALRDGSRGF